MASSPLTRSYNVRLLRTIPTRGIIEEWQQVFGLDISAELRGASEIEHYRCEDSGLEFFLPTNLEGSPQLYAGLQRFEWYYKSHVWELDLAFGDVRGSRRLVEVGSGSGAFVSRCRAAGIDALGLDTNPEACRWAADHDIPTESLTLASYVQQGRPRVDAVCAFQVLEHMANPREFLEDCREALAPGGVLLLSVPNANGYLRHLDDPLDRPPHHMTRWPVRAFREVAQILPFALDGLVEQPLGMAQIPHFLRAQTTRFRARGLVGRLAFNRATLPVVSALLFAGVRRMLTGHSLYVRLRRLH
jgi:SAM-dependent methyltransferase